MSGSSRYSRLVLLVLVFVMVFSVVAFAQEKVSLPKKIRLM